MIRHSTDTHTTEDDNEEDADTQLVPQQYVQDQEHDCTGHQSDIECDVQIRRIGGHALSATRFVAMDLL